MELNCPECRSSVKVPAIHAGQQITCPYCTTVVHPARNTMVSQQEELLEPEPVDAAAADDRRPCPMCGEMIAPQALKCRFCGEVFDPELKKAQKPESGPDDDLTPAEWIFGILCSGIACIMGIVWLIQGKKKGGKLIAVAFVAQMIFGVLRVMAEAGSSR